MKLFLLGVLLISSYTGIAQGFDEASVAKFQSELDAQYGDSIKSPLMKQDLANFSGLEYFPANSEFYVIGKLVKTPKEKPFKMKTSTDRLPMYVKYGVVHFTFRENEYQLNVYRNIELSMRKGYEDYLFLPFSDLTSGHESYIGGRYIDVRVPDNDQLVIDFNKAYNPYCAYNHAYSCPIVPLENDLPIEVYAGVKSFHN